MWASSDIETNALQLDSFLCMSREILMLISLGCLEFQKLKNNELSRLTTLEKNAVLLHFHFPKIWSPTWERGRRSEASVQTEFVYINLQSELQLNKLNELLLACAFPPHPPRRRRQTTTIQSNPSNLDFCI